MVKVYITRKIPQIAQELLEKKFVVEINQKGVLPREKLADVLTEYDAVLSTIPDKIDQSLLEKAKVKVISNYAIGLDNIDTEFAKKKNIAVFNTPKIVTDSTADFTLALLLSSCRKIVPAAEFVKKNLWQEWDPDLFVGSELKGKTFGILGFGRIGQAVARRVLSFGLKVIFFQRRPITLSADLKECRQVSLEGLYQAADFISLHVPMTDETRHMVNLSAFQQMKKKPLILNLARGPVIKTDDLVEALSQKMIKGAALDVTDPEPIAGHPLFKFDNCLIVPHIGTATEECRFLMAKKAAENIIEFFNP
jgi:glyoxylate reductase